VLCTELLNIKVSPDIIPWWPIYNYQLSLQIAASTFKVQAVQHFKLSAIHTKYRKTLTFTNRAVPICTAASPHFTVLPVPDTRTTFTYCCSFNWKRNTNGTFVLSIITSALDTCVLWVSRPGRFIFVEGGHYKLPWRLCGPNSQSGRFGGHRIHPSLPEFEPRCRPSQSLFHRPTAPIFFKKSQVEKVSNLQQIFVEFIRAHLCTHSC